MASSHWPRFIVPAGSPRTNGQPGFGFACEVVRFDSIRHLSELTDPSEPAAVYTALERVHCARKGASLHSWAGRLAAKRAVARALNLLPGTDVNLLDIEILPGPHGRPQVKLHGRVRERCRQAAHAEVVVTITHSGDTAAACALVCLPSPG